MEKPAIYAAMADYALPLQHKDDRDALSLYGCLQGQPIEADRFGFLNQFSPWRVTGTDAKVPEPAAACSAEAFSDICSGRAQAIMKRARDENLDIYVSYSGGVDSTCVLASLLREGVDTQRLHVLCTKESEEEYPLFYNMLANEGVHLIDVTGMPRNKPYVDALDTGLLVTGWCGDQLFGSDLNIAYEGWFHKPWQDFIRFFAGMPEVDRDYSPAIGQLEASFEHYGMPIRNFAQFVWWLNFSCKWNFVISHTPFLVGRLTDRSVPFFAHEDFQRWSMARFDLVDSHPPQETAFYKPEMKRVIYDVTHDDDYLRNKGKIGSWKFVIRNTDLLMVGIWDTAGLHTGQVPYAVVPQRRAGMTLRIARKMFEAYRREPAVMERI